MAFTRSAAFSARAPSSKRGGTVSAVISLDTGLPQEAAMLLGVGLIGSAQVTARHWLERDSKLTREQAQTLVTNIIWRGISGFPRNEN